MKAPTLEIRWAVPHARVRAMALHPPGHAGRREGMDGASRE